jgi:hypothetical protein
MSGFLPACVEGRFSFIQKIQSLCIQIPTSQNSNQCKPITLQLRASSQKSQKSQEPLSCRREDRPRLEPSTARILQPNPSPIHTTNSASEPSREDTIGMFALLKMALELVRSPKSPLPSMCSAFGALKHDFIWKWNAQISHPLLMFGALFVLRQAACVIVGSATYATGVIAYSLVYRIHMSVELLHVAITIGAILTLLYGFGLSCHLCSLV